MDENLIYDIGMNNGDDTAFYLYKGYSVVAVEANPVLAEKARRRFAREIEQGRLNLLNVGVESENGKSIFWVNEDNDEWSSFIKEVGCRDNTACHSIEVECLKFSDILKKYGTPYYLKIDIEGNDLLCLKDLCKSDLPKYVSVESHRLEYLCLLYALGYRGFKVVNQAEIWKYNNSEWVFNTGATGPFGDELSEEWEDIETVAYDWLHIKLKRPERSSLNYGWYDFHASLEKPANLPFAKKPPKFRKAKVFLYESKPLQALKRMLRFFRVYESKPILALRRASRYFR